MEIIAHAVSLCFLLVNTLTVEDLSKFFFSNARCFQLPVLFVKMKCSDKYDARTNLRISNIFQLVLRQNKSIKPSKPNLTLP